MSSVTVKIPTPLRPLTAGQAEVKIEGATVGEVLLKMDSQFKGFSDRIMDNGKAVKRFINVFVNEDNIRDKKELATEVKNGDTISILPSIAGGCGALYKRGHRSCESIARRPNSPPCTTARRGGRATSKMARSLR
jgi:molybdopterin synthase sulfur carrier subunit